MSAALKIFIIYAREDEIFKISLLKAFKPLHRTGKIEIFHDGLIKPGERWEEAILENLRTAHIILPLVSTDFFDSEFIHEVEFKKAVDRYNKGETTIIPIILKHCGWKYDPIIPTLQVLPKDGKPVEAWALQGEAWEQVLDAVHEVTEQTEKEKERRKTETRLKKEENQKTVEQNQKLARQQFNIAMHANDIYAKIRYLNDAIRLDPEFIDAYYKRADAKCELGRDSEAIEDYDQVIRFDSQNLMAFSQRGIAKEKIGLFEEAKEDFQKALSINPNYLFARFKLSKLEKEIPKL